MSANETIWRLEKIKEEYGYEKFLRVLKIVEEHLSTKKSPQNKIKSYLNKNKKCKIRKAEIDPYKESKIWII